MEGICGHILTPFVRFHFVFLWERRRGVENIHENSWEGRRSCRIMEKVTGCPLLSLAAVLPFTCNHWSKTFYLCVNLFPWTITIMFISFLCSDYVLSHAFSCFPFFQWQLSSPACWLVTVDTFSQLKDFGYAPSVVSYTTVCWMVSFVWYGFGMLLYCMGGTGLVQQWGVQCTLCMLCFSNLKGDGTVVVVVVVLVGG